MPERARPTAVALNPPPAPADAFPSPPFVAFGSGSRAAPSSTHSTCSFRPAAPSEESADSSSPEQRSTIRGAFSTATTSVATNRAGRATSALAFCITESQALSAGRIAPPRSSMPSPKVSTGSRPSSIARRRSPTHLQTGPSPSIKIVSAERSRPHAIESPVCAAAAAPPPALASAALSVGAAKASCTEKSEGANRALWRRGGAHAAAPSSLAPPPHCECPEGRQHSSLLRGRHHPSAPHSAVCCEGSKPKLHWKVATLPYASPRLSETRPFAGWRSTGQGAHTSGGGPLGSASRMERTTSGARESSHTSVPRPPLALTWKPLSHMVRLQLL